MKLTSLENSAVLKAYNAYWEYYLKGDVAGLATLLDDEYTQIGSVEGEVFNNKKDAVQFVQSTIDQIAGKVDMRNRKITMEPVEHSVLITEQTDLYILIEDEWNFYAKFRASSLMQKRGGNWKFIHQHSSMPDIRAEEGDNIATEKIAKENLELRDAVKRRTIELEQKNSELAMEAALERVRTVAMGMRKLDELPGICEVLYKELQQMGFSELRNAMINIHNDENGSFVNYDYSDEIGRSINHLNYNIHPVLEKQFKEIRSTHDAFSETVYKGKDLDDWKAFRKDIGEKDDPRIDQTEALYYYFYSIGTGSIGISTFSAITEEKLQQLKRFRNVFEFAYRRYTDVAQAEAQARESQIQLALERVRARTMAMQHSAELKDAASVLFQQVKELGIDAWTCGYNIWEDDRKTVTSWLSRGVIQPPFKIPITENPTLNHFYEAAQRGESLFVEEVSGETLTELYNFLGRQLVAAGVSEAIRQPGYRPPEFQVNHAAFFSYGHLLFVTYKPYPEAHDIFKRFAAVFEQTYTRFLDLEKAEEQAREAQIEAALERVRSRSMAMHRSEELLQVITVVSEQLQHLNFKFNTVSFAINNQEHDYRFWFAVIGNPIPVYIQVPYLKNPMFDRVKEMLSKGFGFYTDTLTPDENRQWHEHVFANADFSFLTEETKAYILRSGYARSVAITPGIMLIISNYAGKPYSEDENEIIKRFANVFDQSYTRFLDLQRAEAQARDAIIEAALEKVRGKAMAMHNSNDLTATASMVFTELRKLGINPIRCGVGLLSRESRKVILYSATTSEEGDNLLLAGWALLDEHPVLTEIYDSWYRNEEYFPVLKGEMLKTYYKKITSNFTLPDSHAEYEQYGYFLPFPEGSFYGWLEKPLTDAELKLLNRFKQIIDLTFRRYLELQKSEANALEAIRRASLDRVRAEIASMRTIDDLDRITPLIWSELTILGVPFIRCGVFIMDEKKELIHTFLSTPGGKALAAFHLPYHTKGSIQQVLDHWYKKQIFIDHWDQASFAEWTKNLTEQGALVSQENYVNEFPTGELDLHFLPFLQGMLYVGNTGPLKEDEIKLVQSVADAFSTAYARYEDFNKLEEAKRQVDKTLADLKQTQAQLVQAEKMASLGELTAGIAHEIQNPLNFVNNFSEINTELTDEILGAAEKGDLDEIRQLASDIRSNQGKISEHGKRADSIVKGMLQHSRSSTGVKELTDINKLADEYLRLAYHGLRAKDKSFNATLHVDLDPAIGEILIMPQDIGRVLLNLYNNAFYAVAERMKQNQKGYEPMITVTTKLEYDKEGNGTQNIFRNPQFLIRNPTSVVITVQDNGPGIPDSIKDKIFQPFFTTKPTGQGTGLGLSLSYDIIKAHNGEMKHEANNGGGAIFTIILPI